jgi:hypothetical protein
VLPKTPDLPERELNARLRRADWRFLLPTFRPRRAIALGTGALAETVASIAGEVVAAASATACELAVAENPDSRALATLHDALEPGCVCYTEWRGQRGGARRVARLLCAAGFAGVSCYRPWPAPPALPVYWIPYGAPGAAGFVRARRRTYGGRMRRFLADALRRMRRLAGADGLPSPICAVARRPAGGSHPDAGPAAWLSEGWATWGLGPLPERLSTLLVTGGPRSVSKVVLLAFAEPSPVPLVAIKAPRVAAAAAGIRREASALEAVARRRSGSVPGVPRLLFRREIDGVPFVGETALAGRPLETVLVRGTFHAWATKVTDWLVAFAEAAPALPSAHWREAIVEPTFAAFTDAFGAVVDRGLLREAEGVLRHLGDLPPVIEQRDFGPWNLLVTVAGELAVLDWESAAVEGLPALDLLYFLAYASFNVDRAETLERRIASYRRSLDPSSATGAVRRECLTRYLDELGLDPAHLAPLRVLVWLIHAQSEFRHAVADAWAKLVSGPLGGGGAPRRPRLTCAAGAGWSW